ncbi:hypothetical protein CEQ90_03595 [Lewinellaceae bacterium SD302]|nr:hypothetical protein CEQ90_03595 [Lewinellaceae bacterium SD302]
MQSLIKPLLTALAVFAISTATLLAETRHIHVIKMLDDNSENYIVSEGARSIDYGIDRKVEQIRQQLGISTVHYYQISGSNFTRDKLNEVMEYELSYQERDIILLVYAGHGYRMPGSTSVYPKLYFNSYGDGLEMEDLRLALLQKNPSLLINIVVACNVTQYDLSAPPPAPTDGNPPPVASLYPPATTRSSRALVNSWHHLFIDSPGYTKVVDLFSSDRENFTFISRDGGIFFSELLYTFHEIFAGGNFRDWNEVCNNIVRRTNYRSQERQLTQQPFCRFELFISATVEVEEEPLSPSECRRIARTVRREQKREMKELRRYHRNQVNGLSRSIGDYRQQKSLLVARQKQEKANLRLTHLQNYQRSLVGCR